MTQDDRTRIFVISMRESLDRRAAFAERANDAPVPWHFFDAHTEAMPGLVYDDAAAKVIRARSLTKAEIGCYASHYALWTQLLDDAGAEQYVVLEDDVIIDWNFLKRIAQVDFGRSGIDYLRLYCLRPGSFVVRKYRYLENRHLIQLMDPAYGTQGYVITRGGARRLIPRCNRIVRPIDSQLDRYWDHGIPNLCLFPFPIIEQFVSSTIGNLRSVAEEQAPGTRIERKLRWTRDQVERAAWRMTRSFSEFRDACDFVPEGRQASQSR